MTETLVLTTARMLIFPCKTDSRLLSRFIALLLLLTSSVMSLRMDEGRQPLSRKVPIKSSKINPYRMLIILRLVILGLFFHYRILHPVKDAYALWLISVICEIWFAVSWVLDQFPKWYPIERETYLDRLSLRYEKEGKPSELAGVDVFVSTVDPLKEPPLITANTVLSILAVDYPADRVACYVSDDGAAMLTFEALSETAEFARKWVPFCKKYNIEPRAPEWYFCHKMDYLKNKVQPAFVRERRAMKVCSFLLAPFIHTFLSTSIEENFVVSWFTERL